MRRVLVTGAGGLIGEILREGLAGRWDLRGLDGARGAGVDVRGDMRRLRSIREAFEGTSAVVDLAADASASASWRTVLENNVPATVNALEAARLAGVERVVFASSNHVVGLYELDEPYASIVAGRYESLDPASLPRIRADAAIRPDSPYAVGKALGEAAARYYAEAHGLSVICLRIGTVNRADRPRNPRELATLLTHRDLVHLVECSLAAAAEVRFAVLYGVSANTWRIWDLDEARAVVGFTPQDDAERFRPL
jgi:uronate dehydrogenase